MKYLIIAILLQSGSGVFAQQKPLPTVKRISTASDTIKKTEIEYQILQKNLKKLETQKQQLLSLMHEYDQLQTTVLSQIAVVEDVYNATDVVKNKIDARLNATKEMHENQMSFNLQYLQLQSQMQHENRSYTAISNIMKTKHDTVKNSISNIR